MPAVSWSWVRPVGEIGENYATIAALLAGGIWTYLLYVHHRQHQPRLRIDLEAVPIELQTGAIVRVQVLMENIGNVIAKLDHANLRVRQVVPLPTEILALTEAGLDPVAADRSHVEWPLICERNWKAKSDPHDIEPGEHDVLLADFLVPADVQVLELYFFFANEKKRKRELGWSESKIVKLQTGGVGHHE